MKEKKKKKQTNQNDQKQRQKKTRSDRWRGKYFPRHSRSAKLVFLTPLRTLVHREKLSYVTFHYSAFGSKIIFSKVQLKTPFFFSSPLATLSLRYIIYRRYRFWISGAERENLFHEFELFLSRYPRPVSSSSVALENSTPPSFALVKIYYAPFKCLVRVQMESIVEACCCQIRLEKRKKTVPQERCGFRKIGNFIAIITFFSLLVSIEWKIIHKKFSIFVLVLHSNSAWSVRKIYTYNLYR